MTVLEEIVNKFVEHPSQVTNGAPTLAKRWGRGLTWIWFIKLELLLKIF